MKKFYAWNLQTDLLYELYAVDMADKLKTLPPTVYAYARTNRVLHKEWVLCSDDIQEDPKEYLKKKHEDINQEIIKEKTATCYICGKEFIRYNKKHQTCSEECAKINHRSVNREYARNTYGKNENKISKEADKGKLPLWLIEDKAREEGLKLRRLCIIMRMDLNPPV